MQNTVCVIPLCLVFAVATQESKEAVPQIQLGGDRLEKPGRADERTVLDEFVALFQSYMVETKRAKEHGVDDTVAQQSDGPAESRRNQAASVAAQTRWATQDSFGAGQRSVLGELVALFQSYMVGKERGVDDSVAQSEEHAKSLPELAAPIATQTSWMTQDSSAKKRTVPDEVVALFQSYMVETKRAKERGVDDAAAQSDEHAKSLRELAAAVATQTSWATQDSSADKRAVPDEPVALFQSYMVETKRAKERGVDDIVSQQSHEHAQSRQDQEASVVTQTQRTAQADEATVPTQHA